MAGKAGFENLDVHALSPEQQEKLRQFKIQTRIANEKYLRSHPEVETLISNFLRELLLNRPADIREFAADHFCDPNLHINTGTQMRANNSMEEKPVDSAS